MAAGDDFVGVANIGLIAIGEDPITSLDDDSKAAILVKSRFHQIRREILRAHNWNFARKRAQLAANAVNPAFGYAKAYDLPGDFIRMFQLPGNESSKWEVENGQILTDVAAPLNVRYIYDHSDPTKWDPLFVAALGHAIGAEMAMPLTQSKEQKTQQYALVGEKIAIARTAGAQENASPDYDIDVLLDMRQ